MTLDHKGLLPSMRKFFKNPFKKPHKEKSHKIDEIVPEDDKSHFKYFWRFYADNETYLVPIDHEQFEKGIYDKTLLFDIISGRQNKVLNHDYTEIETDFLQLENIIKERFREYLIREGIGGIVLEEDVKKRAYQYYHPNRDHGGYHEDLKLKKVDDGTFINNGYR